MDERMPGVPTPGVVFPVTFYTIGFSRKEYFVLTFLLRESDPAMFTVNSTLQDPGNQERLQEMAKKMRPPS